MMPIVYPSMRPFFFDINEGTLCQSQNWYVAEFMSSFRLTQRGHPFVGFDDIREWLIEQNAAFTIDGVRIYESSEDAKDHKATYGSRFIIRPMNGKMTCAIPAASAVLVMVDDKIAPMFKMRWS